MFPESIFRRVSEWRERRSALSELRSMQRDAAAYVKFDQSVLVGRIKAAALQERPDDAVKAWQELHVLAPDIALTSSTSIRALIELGLFDMVDDILAKARVKYARSVELAELYAEASLRRGDIAEANRRWELVRRSFPDRPRAYTFGGMCLKALNRFDEADAMLVRAIAMEPADTIAASEYAKVAEERGDIDEALRRWHAMRERIQDVDAWVLPAAILRQQGRAAEALELLNDARWRFQRSARPSVELARLAFAQGDIEDAMRQWAGVRDHFPQEPAGYVAAAHILRDRGQLEEAETLLAIGADRIANDPTAALEYAFFAHGRDWPEAVRRWEIVRDRFPDRVEGYSWGADALEKAGQPEAAAALRARRH